MFSALRYLVLLGALLLTACNQAYADAPAADLGPWLHITNTRTSAQLSTIPSHELWVIAQDDILPPEYQVVEGHAKVNQPFHFEGALAADTHLRVEAVDDGGSVIAAWDAVDELHGFEGQRGAPAAPETMGYEATGPLGLRFHYVALMSDGTPGALLSQIKADAGYEASAVTLTVSARRRGMTTVIP